LELCREFGIYRKTGYKIFDRYQECGMQGLTGRSRRPYRYANQLPFQVENYVLNGTGSGDQHRPVEGEQYGLTWDMVDWKSRELHIPCAKNEEPLHVPLNDAAISALKAVFESGDGKGRVFTSAKTGEPLENGSHRFDDALVEAKLKNFHWHDLRHTVASRLRMKGAPLEDLADLLGHKSLTMTRRYAHLGPNRLQAVASLLGASDPTSDTGQTAAVPQVAVQ
jgi:hypothetical protein